MCFKHVIYTKMHGPLDPMTTVFEYTVANSIGLHLHLLEFQCKQLPRIDQCEEYVLKQITTIVLTVFDCLWLLK